MQTQKILQNTSWEWAWVPDHQKRIHSTTQNLVGQSKWEKKRRVSRTASAPGGWGNWTRGSDPHIAAMVWEGGETLEAGVLQDLLCLHYNIHIVIYGIYSSLVYYGFSMLLGLDWLFPFHIWDIFDYSHFKNFLRPFLFLFFFWTPVIQMLVHLILSQRSLRLSTVLFIRFPLFCSLAVISTILYLPAHLSVLLPQIFCYWSFPEYFQFQ